MNQSFKDTISEALDMEPNTSVIIAEQKKLLVIDPEADFKMSHQNTLKIVEVGMTALKEMSELANQSQHPRAYEVLTNHIKVMVEIQEKFLGLKIPGTVEGTPSQQTTNVNNAIMVGSTADLQRMLKSMQEDNVIDITPEEVNENE